MMKKTLLGILLSFNSLFLWSQDYYEDMQKVVNQMETNEGFHISSQIIVFNGSRKNSIVQKIKADLQKNESCYRTRIDDTEIISNEKMLITIDHEDKTIQITRKAKVRKSDQKLMDEIANLADKDSSIISIEFLEENSGVRKYKTTMNGDVKSAIVAIDVNRNCLKSVTYFYDENKFPTANYVEINYTVFEHKIDIQKSFLNGEDMLKEEGKKFVLTPAFVTYEIIDLYHV